MISPFREFITASNVFKQQLSLPLIISNTCKLHFPLPNRHPPSSPDDRSLTDLEPVDRAAVDERGEKPQPVSERVSYRAEGDDDVQLGLALAHEEREQGQGT